MIVEFGWWLIPVAITAALLVLMVRGMRAEAREVRLYEHRESADSPAFVISSLFIVTTWVVYLLVCYPLIP